MVEIADCFPLLNRKNEQTGTIYVSVNAQEHLHNISTATRSEMGTSVNRTQVECPSHMQSQVSHLGRIERSYDYPMPGEYSVDDEDEKQQLQLIKQELKEQNNSIYRKTYFSL